MSRIACTFERLQQSGRKALIPYVMAGDPYADATVEIMHALVAGGADLIELGVPFSDPMADGPVIQHAAERSLARGTTLAKVLETVRHFRQVDEATPVVLMGYANPIEHYDWLRGEDRFVVDAAQSGVDGVLVVDYPPEEMTTFASVLKAHGLDPILLLAPTSTDERMEQVGRVAAGYVYYVSLKGVTGAGTLDTQAVAEMIPRIRRHVSVPVGVGFGIRDAASARAVGLVADAVVIGSRIIALLEHERRDHVAAQARTFIGEIRAALDAK